MDASRRNTLYTLTAAAMLLTGCPLSQRKARVRAEDAKDRQQRIVDPATTEPARAPGATTDDTSAAPQPSPNSPATP